MHLTALALALFSLAAPVVCAADMTYSPAERGQKTAFIRLNGEIKPGDAAALEQKLATAQASGKEIAVILSSGIGDYDEAMRMGRAIRKYHADTLHGYCASACVIAFLGGERRYLVNSEETDALLISRPPYADDYFVVPTPQLKRHLDILRSYVLEMTGGTKFYSAMMAIPSSPAHTLGPEEALSIKAVTKTSP